MEGAMNSRKEQEWRSTRTQNVYDENSTDDHMRKDNYQRFLSFLEVDNSFLTPWSFNPDASRDFTSNNQRYMSLACGSFFSYDERFANLGPHQDKPIMVKKEGSIVAHDVGFMTRGELGQSSSNQEVINKTKEW